MPGILTTPGDINKPQGGCFSPSRQTGLQPQHHGDFLAGKRRLAPGLCAAACVLRLVRPVPVPFFDVRDSVENLQVVMNVQPANLLAHNRNDVVNLVKDASFSSNSCGFLVEGLNG